MKNIKTQNYIKKNAQLEDEEDFPIGPQGERRFRASGILPMKKPEILK